MSSVSQASTAADMIYLNVPFKETSALHLRVEGLCSEGEVLDEPVV